MTRMDKITKLLYAAEKAFEADNLERCNRLELYVVKYERLAKEVYCNDNRIQR